jgi:hypothetical protein
VEENFERINMGFSLLLLLVLGFHQVEKICWCNVVAKGLKDFYFFILAKDY